MNTERLYSIIIAPHISEKTTLMSESANQHAFKVAIDASRDEIKSAVETIFNVAVKDIQVLNVKGKLKRTARNQLRRKKNWKKAYVRLEAGHEINIINNE
ncbi:MAG: 50S ribosomal protein L23 [Gammaproteobacteria bacterium]|nr:50S ribosomal protein L23 [Gammaproteobacteria bacterium]MCY4356022.1 50S ribosomal protein L23 [Gammaproteobacteria bacterium]